MYNWLVLLPPLIVVICALITRRMILSFFIGIVIAALIATQGSFYQAALLTVKRFGESSGITKLTNMHDVWTNWSICIFAFLICLGILLITLQYTGGAEAFQRIANRQITSKKSAEVGSLILSLFFFIDDYFSALTVGSVMRPIAYLHKVHPVKLAFLVTAMAQPLTILSPLSSWVGEIVLQLKQVGIDNAGPGTIIAADPYYVFLSTIPLLFYAIILVACTWYIVLRGISYGPMACYESEFMQLNPAETALSPEAKSASFIDFILPLFLLISTVFVTLLFTGNFYWFGRNNGFVDALKSGSVHQALLIGGLSSVVISFIYFLSQKKMALQNLLPIITRGTALMLPSIIMLIHAWTLSLLLKQDLHTGAYVASFFVLYVSQLFFPVVCFLSSALIAWMIGSAWATMGLMFPIVVPMVKTLLALPSNTPLDAVPFILPVIGATLSGCIMGTHVSLISDNPIMASASTGANHFNLVQAMSWYVAPVAVACTSAYCVLGIVIPIVGLFHASALSLLGGIFVGCLLLESGQWMFGKRVTQ